MDLAQRMARVGLFRMLTPREVGGGELPPMQALEIIEMLASADAAVAWCVMVCATTGMLAAYLDVETAREIFGDPAGIVGGVAAPRGRAQATGDGFIVSGQWDWASASRVCTWLVGGCFSGAGAAREQRIMFVPAASVTLTDNWRAMGLKGTGSGLMSIDEVFVPERRTILLSRRPPEPSRPYGPLYAFPPQVMAALAIAAVGCGIATAASQDFVAVMAEKLDRSWPPEPRAVVQAEVAQATARQRGARALLQEEVIRAWEIAVAKGRLSPPILARLRLAATHAARVSAETCRLVQDWAGGDGVPLAGPLERRLRDAQTLTAHALVSPRNFQELGKAMVSAEAAI